jgi:hypothetical protein
MYYYALMNKEKLTVERDEEGTINYRNADGELHNPHGPTAVFYADGHKDYWVNAKPQYPDGPAVVGLDGWQSALD